MPAYTQQNRLIQVNTPLGKDVLFALSLYGSEGLSQLYRYSADVMAQRTTHVPFDSLIGQTFNVGLQLPDASFRYFHGLCVQLVQGDSDNDFTYYQMEMVPKVWTLTKRTQSRIFQHITVPDILKKVLAGFDVEYKIAGTFDPRDYCVQYRETDWNFACRLMEEEGIYYFFKHAADKHTLVLANTKEAHPNVPGQSKITYKRVYEGAAHTQDYISELSKVQEQTAGKFTLRDHTFELPHQSNEAQKQLLDSVQVGQVSHKLRVGDNGKLEVYDWPGEYAQRFDGIDRGGSPQPQEIAKVGKDNARTVGLRMEQEAAKSVRVHGSSFARQLTSGHKFTLNTLATDPRATPIKGDGEYVLSTVSHAIRVGVGNYRGNGDEATYSNTFTAIPSALPYRPQREAPKPVVSGSQSAVVVGPKGEEIFTDKYGRIKVQFHWDREGQNDANSSCWIRVAQISAGRAWGGVSIPRVGQEVIVDFLEGDPDQPICIGSVYNPDQMPMYTLPENKTRSYIRTNSSPGGSGYNAIRMEDKAGQEQVYVHAQKDMDERVRNDSKERVGMDRHLRVGFYLPSDHTGDTSGESKKGNQYEEVAVDQHLKVHRNKEEWVGGDSKLLIGGIDGPGKLDIHVKDYKAELIDKTSDLIVKQAVTESLEDSFDQTIHGPVTRTFESSVDDIVADGIKQTYASTVDTTISSNLTRSVGGNSDLTVGGNASTLSGGNYSLTVGGKFDHTTGANHSVTAAASLTLQAGTALVLECDVITLKGGGGFITISPAGIAIQGNLVLINSGGAAIPGVGAAPTTPQTAKTAKNAKKAKKAKDADPVKPKDADVSKTGAKSN